MITSKTKLLGLLGHPVQHSQSPLMHNSAFAYEKLDFAYVAFDVSPEHLADAVAGIRAMGIRGVNVTIPHKVAIMPFLDEIDPLAKKIGAVNTIVNEQGRLIGYNTDGLGYVKSLLEETKLDLSEQIVTIIGAGGAARAVACTLAEQGVQEIRIVNRSLERAEKLANHLASMTKVIAIEAEKGEAALNGATLLINTTSIGMHPLVTEMPVPLSWLHADIVVSDLIYNPLETKLLLEAKEIGAKTHSGVGMFVYQGALAYELWTKQSAPTQLMRATVLSHLCNQEDFKC